MSIPAAYIGVILIWSTTPLAIKWSGEGVGFLFGVTGRMALGVLAGLLVATLLRMPLPWHGAARRTYVAAGLGIFVAMLMVYWSSQYIPSGWIAVLFGLAPIVTGVMAALWLGERSITPYRVGGMLLGLAGLGVIFIGAEALGPKAIFGIAGVLVSVCTHSASAVAIKRINAGLPGLVVTVGGLLVAVPLFVAVYLLSATPLPVAVPLRAGLSIVYLGLVGSVLGFALYFYVLRQVEATRVALITLITPVTALLLGHLLNGEPIGAGVWVGTSAILMGLLLYEYGPRVVGCLRTTVS